MMKYLPEGFGFSENQYTYTLANLEQARVQNKIIEARATMCDSSHNLIVDLGCMKGIVPRINACVGIKDGSVRDIAVLSRAGKICCFYVEGYEYRNGERFAVLNREKAMREALFYMTENLHPGDVIDAKITHIERFGAFADIGCGNVGLINIENCSVSRITHPSERFYCGQRIKAVIKDIDRSLCRFTLSHKELLGTWEDNVSGFSVGQTVSGVVRSVMDYGVFVELTPNLSGLAEIHTDDIVSSLPVPGSTATVYIKSIIPEKMKIKLNMIDFGESQPKEKISYRYFLPVSGHFDSFVYSPQSSDKKIITNF
ncbi:MAG: 30S ribosomal protein S1 [Clostridia bacterium]|nr:30S ribosomal protein S1 [Clostridia bacterium]MBO5299459.1 30S ribosomal protein S1 [Clostridia bacterium]